MSGLDLNVVGPCSLPETSNAADVAVHLQAMCTRLSSTFKLLMLHFEMCFSEALFVVIQSVNQTTDMNLSLSLLFHGLNARWCPWHISRNGSNFFCPSPIRAGCKYPCCTRYEYNRLNLQHDNLRLMGTPPFVRLIFSQTCWICINLPLTHSFSHAGWCWNLTVSNAKNSSNTIFKVEFTLNVINICVINFK